MYIKGTVGDPVYMGAIYAVSCVDAIRCTHDVPPMGKRKDNPSMPSRGFKRYETLAEICIDNGWDVRDYVDNVFFYLGKPVGDVTGLDLISDRATDRYRRYLRNKEK